VERAAVLIGIKKTGNLPELQAVTSRIKSLKEWAQSQGIPDKRIKTLTDESGEVRIHQITDAIEELVGLSTIEQLIVYFAGHGVNNRGESWLLSRAPANPNEAVNVEGSLLLARYCGISHVVCISDACRTAAEGIQAQHVTGSEIFPNDLGAEEKPVDAFFACARGKPSLEVRNPVESAGVFSALYTDELIACLKGERPDMLEYLQGGDSSIAVARAWKLADHLSEKVPALLKAKLGVTPKLTQTPVARITSRNAWVSQVTVSPERGRKRNLRRGAPAMPVSRGNQTTPFTVSENLLAAALDGDMQRWRDVLGGIAAGETSVLRDSVISYVTPFGPTHFETNCGLKLRGAKVKNVYCKGVSVDVLDSEGTIIRVGAIDKPAANILLELQNGNGLLVPAIPEFIAELSFEANELANVVYEPSDKSRRWNDYSARRNELRVLRAAIAASVGLGVFRLTGDDALKLASRMRLAKGIDPSMALYAAYAYHDLQRRDLVKEMLSYLREDLKFVFFDIAMLSGDPGALSAGARTVVPPFPMLSQGWTLLSALRIKLPGALGDFKQHLLPSLWTMFNATGVEKLKSAIELGEVH
jgi:hypothetical protein